MMEVRVARSLFWIPKKFTDLMDKRMSTDFGIIARGFVSAGGTLIALAHTKIKTQILMEKHNIQEQAT